jgi:hypothetical protein
MGCRSQKPLGRRTIDAPPPPCIRNGTSDSSTELALGCITAIQFVATIELVHVLVLLKLIEKNEIEVTCDDKVMLQTYLGKTCSQITSNRIHSRNLPWFADITERHVHYTAPAAADQRHMRSSLL